MSNHCQGCATEEDKCRRDNCVTCCYCGKYLTAQTAPTSDSPAEQSERMNADRATLACIPPEFRVRPTCEESSAYAIAVGASIGAMRAALEDAQKTVAAFRYAAGMLDGGEALRAAVADAAPIVKSYEKMVQRVIDVAIERAGNAIVERDEARRERDAAFQAGFARGVAERGLTGADVDAATAVERERCAKVCEAEAERGRKALALVARGSGDATVDAVAQAMSESTEVEVLLATDLATRIRNPEGSR